MCFRPSDVKKTEKKCPSCETANPPDAAVCSNCGAQLPVSAASTPPPGAPGGVTPPKAPPAPPKAPPAPPKKPAE